ncbi:hypothetical protein FAEPRAM212_01827 [Faecalibacterium prausnitzii M21/2]|uniref:Uncharacterized protein n=1 Tax=Faecalibacterium prausnitzii M21/2 TaxID=411485 RepID=A8SC19_9FIRM|nr:hypothetical protein FAEPRAM212_01827 [Faecalibacterium prausnitzii M21/2]
MGIVTPPLLKKENARRIRSGCSLFSCFTLCGGMMQNGT